MQAWKTRRSLNPEAHGPVAAAQRQHSLDPRRINGKPPPDVRPLFRLSIYPDKALLFKVKNNFLSGLLRRQVGGVDHHFRVRWSFVGVGNTSEFLDDSRPRLGIESLTVALLTDLQRGCDVNQDEAAEGLNDLTHRLADRIIGSDGGADGDAAVLGNLRGDIADAANIDVAMLLGETKVRR